MGRGSGCSGPPRIQQFSLAASEEPTWAEAAGKRRISTEDPELAADMFLNTVLGRASRVRTHPRARTCHECVTNRSRGVRVSCVQVWSKRPCNPWTTRSAQVVTPMSQVRSVTHVSGPDLGKGGCGGSQPPLPNAYGMETSPANAQAPAEIVEGASVGILFLLGRSGSTGQMLGAGATRHTTVPTLITGRSWLTSRSWRTGQWWR